MDDEEDENDDKQIMDDEEDGNDNKQSDTGNSMV